MTREEALNKAINIVSYFEAHFAKSKEAREDAVNIIEALEQEPCEDAISRAKAMTEIMMNTNIREHLDGNLYIKVADAVQILRDLPSVKPQERTGHWNLFHTTEHGMREDSYFKCNRCNYESYKEYNFCPDCGAKMVELQESEVQE